MPHQKAIETRESSIVSFPDNTIHSLLMELVLIKLALFKSKSDGKAVKWIKMVTSYNCPILYRLDIFNALVLLDYELFLLYKSIYKLSGNLKGILGLHVTC